MNRMPDDAGFERQLRGDLRRLARRGGLGPGPEDVTAALRRRRARRIAVAAGVVLAVLAGTVVVLSGRAPRRGRPEPTARRPADPVEVEGPPRPALPEPLAADAPHAELGAALRAYLVSLGAPDRVAFDKDPTTGLSFVVSGRVNRPPADIRRGLACLLRNFDHARARMAGPRLSFQLVVQGAAHRRRRPQPEGSTQ